MAGRVPQHLGNVISVSWHLSVVGRVCCHLRRCPSVGFMPLLGVSVILPQCSAGLLCVVE